MAAATICSTEREVWQAIGDHLVELVEAGDVLASGWLEENEPAIVTPVPHGRDVIYDPARVEKVVRTLAQFEQIKGRWAGRPLRLLDWQFLYEIAPVFGLVRWHELPPAERRGDELGEHRRIIRTAWFEKPRKNGKSTECSGLGLVLAFADDEPGAEVYAAARNKDQARIVFTPAKTMAERCGPLRRKLGPRGIQRNLLENPSTSSIFRPLASDLGGSLHGLNVHGGIVDEVHVHKSPDTIDAIETGTGSRTQPLVVFITTADEGLTGSIYDTKRSYVEALAEGHAEDETFYGVVFAASAEAIELRPFEDSTLIAANPGVGWTVELDYLRSKAREAKSSPAQLNRYLRLHLGKRTKQSVAWFTMAQWDTSMGLAPTADEWRKAVAYAGIDLSATTDFTAAAIIAPDPQTDGAGYIGRAMFWLPEQRVDTLEKLTGVPLRRWADEGWIHLTEGNVVDYSRFREDLSAEISRLGCTVAEVGYDPWNAAETVQEMQTQRRNPYTMVPIRQGYASLSGPSKELERLVMGSTPELPLLRFGWNPVLRWMADCVEVMQDPSGNIKPTKPDRRKSSKRIDGIAALVNAIARAMLRAPAKKRRRAGGVA
jgi:phage terminase large subunit-like protein